MVMNRAVQVRFTRDQHERLKQNAEQKGFPSIATYVRWVSLQQDVFLEQRIMEIHAFLLGKEKR